MIKEVYKTKQRYLIEECIRKNSERHLTVEQIEKLLTDDNIKVGRTTIYRSLELMINDGKIRKYILSGKESACYQYINENNECCEHFHLKCEKCGKLIHIECEHINELSSHISKEHGFEINKLKTVLYGICEDCKRND